MKMKQSFYPARLVNIRVCFHNNQNIQVYTRIRTSDFLCLLCCNCILQKALECSVGMDAITCLICAVDIGDISIVQGYYFIS